MRWPSPRQGGGVTWGAPEDAAVRRGVAAVQRVLVVAVQGEGQGALRRRRPTQEGLAPRHAYVVVELAGGHQLLLRGVPERVPGLSRGSMPPLVTIATP